MTTCPLCTPSLLEPPLWADAVCRVVLAHEPGLGDFCRVIWHAHLPEMTDLTPADSHHLFTVVLTVEQVLRTLTDAVKINLASLGNRVPHLHWHVIPRYVDDPFFPDSIWSTPRRTVITRPSIHREDLVTALHSMLPNTHRPADVYS